MPEFSVIIPTFNEETSLHHCIQNIRLIDPAAEIVVADGGSEDNTVNIAVEAGVALSSTMRCRGKQLNAAVKEAHGDILVFLHADTKLPPGCFADLREYFSRKNAKVAVFNMEFDVRHWLLKMYSAIVKRSRWLVFGDQCICVKRSFFESLGGFDDLPLFEDLLFAMKAAKVTRIARLKSAVITSSRRYIRNGIFRQQMIDNLYVVMFFLGISPLRLAGRYYRFQSQAGKKTAAAIIMRYPRAGRVKTRLAVEVGEEASAGIYYACVEHLFLEFKKLSPQIHLYIAFEPPADYGLIKKWAGPKFLYMEQGGEDLGQKLEHAISSMLDQGNAKAMVIASDTPGLSPELVMKAAGMLEQNDIVLGPDKGGGYYLVGMKRMHYQIFQGISWSTSAVLQQTLGAAASAGLSVGLLPALTDIDNAGDLRQFLTEEPGLAEAVFGDLLSNLDRLKLDSTTVTLNNGKNRNG